MIIITINEIFCIKLKIGIHNAGSNQENNIPKCVSKNNLFLFLRAMFRKSPWSINHETILPVFGCGIRTVNLLFHTFFWFALKPVGILY